MTKTSPDGEFKPESFWESRYSELSQRRSGHIDLPVAYNSWLYRRKKDCVKNALRNITWPGLASTVLEVGAGVGVYVDMWKSIGIQTLVGLDLVESPVAFLKSKYPEYKFLQADISDPSLPVRLADSFDLVTCFDVLYHVVKDDKWNLALDSLAELTKVGGHLFIHDMFVRCPTIDQGYIKWRTRSEWASAMKRRGFVPVFRRSIFNRMVQNRDFEDEKAAAASEKVWDLYYQRIGACPSLAGRILYYWDTLAQGNREDGPGMKLWVFRKEHI